MVQAPTRGTAVLDKIYSNACNWYNTPTVLPNIGKSDHMSVLLVPKDSDQRPRGKRVRVAVRSNDRGAKFVMEQVLRHHNWTAMYSLEAVEDMYRYFNDTVSGVLDCYLPVRYVFRHTSDKPWITDQFRLLIRQRQFAYTSGDLTSYKKLRNKINRESKTLRGTYFEKRINGLRDSNPRKWWQQVRTMTGSQNIDDSKFTILADADAGGSIQSLANMFCDSLKSVSNDLEPLEAASKIKIDEFPDEYVIYPEEVFSKLNDIQIHKSPGPDNLPNWFLRDFAVYLAEPLCCIFNSSLRQCAFPTG